MSRVSLSGLPGALLLATLAGSVVAAAGCNFIVSSSDYAVGPQQDGGSLGDSSMMMMMTSPDSAGGSSSGGGSDATASSSGTGDGATGDALGAKGDAGVGLGDPCTTNADCGKGKCTNEMWCSQACTTNGACGSNAAGQPNYCVTGDTGTSKTCAPGCASDSDCLSYPNASCLQIPGGVAFVCTSAGDGGGIIGSDASSGSGVIGDPCSSTNPCSEGSCSTNSTWCIQDCTSASDTSCGYNSAFVQNLCVGTTGSSSTGYSCFPGCSTNYDCFNAPFGGTTCQSVTGGSVCAFTNGAVGDPCSTAGASPWTACVAQTSSAPTPTCSNGIPWCTTPCTTDSSCGSNSGGVANYCVAGNGGTKMCFPGCTQYYDCVGTYPGTFCQLIYGRTSGRVCAGTGGAIGDPCAVASDCTTGYCGSDNTCTESCVSDSDCPANSEGTPGVCAFSFNDEVDECFAGCTVDSDCIAYGGTCDSIGTESVCDLAFDASSP